MVLLMILTLQRVLQRYAAAVLAGDVVGDDVVGHRSRRTSAGIGRERDQLAEPLICCRRKPPPLPLSALLPSSRFASITKPGPVPSPSPGGQS